MFGKAFLIVDLIFSQVFLTSRIFILFFFFFFFLTLSLLLRQDRYLLSYPFILSFQLSPTFTMAKLCILATLCCALASVGAAPAPGSGITVGRRIARANYGAVLPRAEEAEDPNKVDQQGQFDTKIALKGGNIQQDTTFPPGVSNEYSIS